MYLYYLEKSPRREGFVLIDGESCIFDNEVILSAQDCRYIGQGYSEVLTKGTRRKEVVDIEGIVEDVLLLPRDRVTVMNTGIHKAREYRQLYYTVLPYDEVESRIKEDTRVLVETKEIKVVCKTVKSAARGYLLEVIVYIKYANALNDYKGKYVGIVNEMVYSTCMITQLSQRSCVTKYMKEFLPMNDSFISDRGIVEKLVALGFDARFKEKWVDDKTLLYVWY